jgi:hypothetical protein
MRRLRVKNKTLYLISAAILLFTITITSAPEVQAQEVLFWTDNAYSSTGATVSTPTLVSGTEYRIVASTMFWYNVSGQLEADAQYYTTANSSWNWINYYPAPNGHSFLQINGSDVNWGSFSNGDANHTYSITFMGTGNPITFQVYDWVDQDVSNNYCHIEISIYQISSVPTPTPSPSPSPVPTASPTPTPTPSPTPSPSPTPTTSPTSSPTPTPTQTILIQNPTPTPTKTPTITTTPTPTPTTINSLTATPLPTQIPLTLVAPMSFAFWLVLIIWAVNIALFILDIVLILLGKKRNKQNQT